MLVDNMIFKGLNPEDFSTYLDTFRYGMPPHGGLAIGLERLTAQLLKLRNVRMHPCSQETEKGLLHNL